MGTVLDGRNRQPIARALVHLGSRAVLTDHDGVFRFPAVSSASASFKPSKPGYYSGPEGDDNDSQTLKLPVSAPIELLLYPESILAGTAVDAAGEGVPHLGVVARRSVFDENGHRWLPAGQTRTANDGSFRIPVPSGTYSLSLSQRGRPAEGQEMVLPLTVPSANSSVLAGIHLAVGEEAHLNLRTESRKSYQVHLVLEPVLRAFPVLTARSTNGSSVSLTAVPDRREDGNDFRVAIPEGTYTLSGSVQTQDGLLEASTQITVTDHDLTSVPLRFTPAPILPVAIEAELSSISEANSKLPEPTQLGLSLQLASAAPDESGQSYRVLPRRTGTPAFSLPSGTYRLHAQASGQWFVTSATCGGVDLLAGTLPVSSDLSGTEVRVRISNQSGNLSGSVLLNGRPGAAWIYLIATTPSAMPVSIFRTGADGNFSRPYLPVGAYRVVALERRVSTGVQANDEYLDHVQSFAVLAGEQHTVKLVAVPASELHQ